MANYIKKNGVVIPLNGFMQYEGIFQVFNVASTDWESNTDPDTSTDYPYIAEIDTDIYNSASKPIWQMNGVGDIPTETEFEECQKVIEAVFDSSGIILYAIEEPSEDLVLEVAGGISVLGAKDRELWTDPVTCAIGDTTCTITNQSILLTSIIEDWCENASGTKIAVPEITVTSGQAVLNFDALEEATSFRLHIINL